LIEYFLSLKSSFAATSRQIETSLPGMKPAFSIACKISSIASSLLDNEGAKPPSSPRFVEKFFFLYDYL
tara:strand:- start:24 stop:230 length:207 start_codon:yes stop_codon:yes gene_type:complete